MSTSKCPEGHFINARDVKPGDLIETNTTERKRKRFAVTNIANSANALDVVVIARTVNDNGEQGAEAFLVFHPLSLVYLLH